MLKPFVNEELHTNAVNVTNGESGWKGWQILCSSELLLLLQVPMKL